MPHVPDGHGCEASQAGPVPPYGVAQHAAPLAEWARISPGWGVTAGQVKLASLRLPGRLLQIAGGIAFC